MMKVDLQELQWTRRRLEAIVEAEAPHLNIASGNNAIPGFVNVDLFGDGGDVIEMDLFDIPWRLPSNGFSYILASHILEHVPHQLPYIGGEGFFAFMSEIIRVARDGALLEVHVPYGSPTRCLCQAGHTRMVTPRTFWAWTKKPGRTRRSMEADRASGMCDMEMVRRTYRRAFAVPRFPITDYHFRKYLRMEFGIAIHQVMVFKIHKVKGRGAGQALPGDNGPIRVDRPAAGAEAVQGTDDGGRDPPPHPKGDD